MLVDKDGSLSENMLLLRIFSSEREEVAEKLHNEGDEVRENLVGRICSRHGGSNVHKNSRLEKLKERIHFEDPNLGGRIQLKMLVLTGLI